jgi:NADPH-dependent 2,4-dienoyl-CoA reductase/sulfur reductase-like enzyme
LESPTINALHISKAIRELNMPKLFIIGGSDAGISAALRARELAPDWHVAVAVSDRYPNFSICGLPYFLSEEVARIDDLSHRGADDIRALGVELMLDQQAEQIDPVARRVVCETKTTRSPRMNMTNS